MSRSRFYLAPVLALAGLLFLFGCGPSKEEIAARKKAGEEKAEKARIAAYLKAQKAPELTGKETFVTGKKGIRWIERKSGTGREALPGETVTVAFIGWADGQKIDSSDDRGQPFSFVLGSDSVIEGWNLGIEGMREGGVRLILIPPALAYGKEGREGFVGPDKTLLFRITLLKVYEPL